RDHSEARGRHRRPARELLGTAGKLPRRLMSPRVELPLPSPQLGRNRGSFRPKLGFWRAPLVVPARDLRGAMPNCRRVGNPVEEGGSAVSASGVGGFRFTRARGGFGTALGAAR